MMDGKRLYLDTADLIEVADRKQPAAVDRLLAACHNTPWVLCFSLWHVIDLRNAPNEDRDRVLLAVEQFPVRALISLSDVGVTLSALTSALELVKTQPDLVNLLCMSVSTLARLTQESPRIHPSVPERYRNLARRVMLDVLQQDSRENAQRVGFESLHRHRRDIPIERHADVVAAITETPWSGALRKARATRVPGDDLTSLLSRTPVRPIEGTHVGRHLGALVAQRRDDQSTRPISDSDVPDRHHVEFAPFVDVFTGDKDLCAWIEEWRPKVSYERSVRALRSRQLDAVTDALTKAESP